MSYTSYVLANPDLIAHYNAKIKSSGKSMEDWGKAHWTKHGSKNENRKYTPQNTSHSSTTTKTVTPAEKTKKSYVDLSPDLAAAWQLIDDYNKGIDVNKKYAGKYKHSAGLTPQQQAEYWAKRGANTKEAFAAAHAGEDTALKTGTYSGATDYTVGSDAWKSLFTTTDASKQFGSSFKGTSSASDPKTRWDLFSPTKTTSDTTYDWTTSYKAPADDDDDVPGPGDPNSVVNEVQTMDLATLTDEMDLTNKLSEVINMNSPLFKAAQTKALQAMQARGIMNSSLATEAVMNAIMGVALPIAQAEGQALQTHLYFNSDWPNKQTPEANKYFYDRMITQLNGKINMQLNNMVQSFGAWGKYGDWLMKIATAPGADQDAWKRMLDMLQGSGGWPSYPG